MKQLLFILIVLSAFGTRAQNGYMGHKYTLTILGGANIPMLSGNFKEAIWTRKGDEMKEGRDWFSYGASAGFMRNMSNRYGIGVFGHLKEFTLLPIEYVATQFNSTQGDHLGQDTIWLRMEPTRFHTVGVMPHLEFFSKMGNGPVGLHHSMGAGISFTYFSRESYGYSVNEFDRTGDQWGIADTYVPREKFPPYKSITLMYGLSMRVPFSEHFAFDIGVTYLANIFIKPSQETLAEFRDYEIFNYSDMYYKSQRANLFSTQLHGGFTFLF